MVASSWEADHPDMDGLYFALMDYMDTPKTIRKVSQRLMLTAVIVGT